MKKIILGICGASGVQYGLRLGEILLKTNNEVFLLVSNSGKKVMHYEVRNEFDLKNNIDFKKQIIRYYKNKKVNIKNLLYIENTKIESKLASGSFKTDSMIILPCSMSTTAAIANGLSNNLIQRAADVVLKERRKLIIAPREMPFNQIHLENILKLNKMGSDIVVPSPGFYHNPKTIEDLIDHVVGKILDLINVDHHLYKRWDEM